ncbi:MAG: hypothetical protein J6X71_04740 [Bacteroidales bacterium]|nr:hypothetical protein [Bacteroidales bacterium]
MKKSVIITAAFAALLFIAACERENTFGPQETGDGISLTFTCGDINTKGKPGVGNENLIKTVDVFLFNGSDPEHNPEFKHHWRFAPEIESNFTCFIQAAVIADDSYNVFSIVNYPGPVSDFIINSTNATLNQLKALALSESVSRSFTAGSTGSIRPAANEDLALVMTGMAENISVAAVSGQTLVGNAEIELKRLPAKVTMDFYLRNEVVNTKGNVTETWTPLTDGSNIRVYLCNGAENAHVGGRDSTSLSLFDYEPSVDNTIISGKENYSVAFSSSSFYTYPENWAYGSASEPYLKLIVPWKLVRSTAGTTQESQKEFYYKVMLPTNKFESNYWYHLILDVTQLGGNADDDAVNVACGYVVVNWKDGSEISSSMSPGYYLDVNVPDPSDIKFYGDEVDIPYFASGAVEITSTKEWEKYSDGSHQVKTSDTDDTGVSNVAANSVVHINNPLNSDFNGTDYDVSPYKYTIVLSLVGDTAGNYNKTLEVTQYPPLYIEANNTFTNSNTTLRVYVNSSSTTSSTAQKVWDNTSSYSSGYISKADAPHYLGSVQSNTSAIDAIDYTASNKNANIYSISTTILNFSPTIDGDVFETVLGDPRGSATDEYETALAGGGSGLTNYRPTAENTPNVISPRFISASSYGKTYSVSYEGARKRCAAYQEYGYPAGRWRLPTKAEILFLQKLNSDGKIPKLYATSSTSAYWAAGHYAFIKDSSNNDKFMLLDDSNIKENSSNAVMYNQDGVDNIQVFVRCVYDTWYWGDAPLTGTGWLGFQTSLN